MFNRESRHAKTGGIDTTIGKEVIIEGNVFTEGSIRIDGLVKGQVESRGDIYLGETGKVHGNLAVRNILVAGEIIGNVTAAGRLEISNTGRITGDINIQKLVVAEGALYRGKCYVGDPPQEDGQPS